MSVTGNVVAQTKEDVEDEMKSDSRTCIVEQVLTNLVPKFSNSKLKCDPHHVAFKLGAQNNG